MAAGDATKTKTGTTRRPAETPKVRTLNLNKKMVVRLRHAREAARKTIEAGKRTQIKRPLHHRQVKLEKMPELASNNNTSLSKKWSMDIRPARRVMQPQVM